MNKFNSKNKHKKRIKKNHPERTLFCSSKIFSKRRLSMNEKNWKHLSWKKP